MKTRTTTALAVALVGALVLSGCLMTKATDEQVVAAPHAGASQFGSAFSMDEDRLVVRATLGGSPVVYVFDADGPGWTHSATINPPNGATSAWGESVAVSGDTIAVADPWRAYSGTQSFGAVSIHDLEAGTWQQRQLVYLDNDWTNFAGDVWLAGDALLVRSQFVCDATCSSAQWDLYQRYGTTFRPAFTSRPERSAWGLSVGVDQGRIAVGNPGFFDSDFCCGWDNGLMVFDANVQLPTILLDELVPIGDPYEDDVELVTDLFRKVDLSGDLLAYESCCTSDDRLHIRRFDGSTYQPEATFTLEEQSEWVSVLPDTVLVADADEGVWHAYAHHDGEWKRSSDLPAPDAVAAEFETPPVTVGDRIAVRGDNVVHVLTIDVVELQAPS